MHDARALPCPLPWRRPDGSPNPAGRATGAPATTDDGLLLPQRQPGRAAGVLLVVLGAVLGALGAVLLTTDGVAAALGGAVLALLGLLLLAAGVFSLIRKAPRTGIELHPEHLTIGWLRPRVRVPWEALTEVRPLAIRLGANRKAPSRNYIGLVAQDADVPERHRRQASRFGKDVAVVFPTTALAVDQLLALHTLRFYRAHPGHRPELAGEAALHRVKEARVRDSHADTDG